MATFWSNSIVDDLRHYLYFCAQTLWFTSGPTRASHGLYRPVLSISATVCLNSHCNRDAQWINIVKFAFCGRLNGSPLINARTSIHWASHSCLLDDRLWGVQFGVLLTTVVTAVADGQCRQFSTSHYYRHVLKKMSVVPSLDGQFRTVWMFKQLIIYSVAHLIIIDMCRRKCRGWPPAL